MLHYTLNTNHSYVQEDYKRGIGPSMAPLLVGGNLGLVAKQLSAFRVTVTRGKGGGLFTVWRGQEPLVTCGVGSAGPSNGSARSFTEIAPLRGSSRFTQEI
jgi:hypothetical protein